MRVGVTSTNKLKVDAVFNAYGSMRIPVEVIGYDAKSGVGAQPVGNQTLEGARNRIYDLRTNIEGLDRIVSIENGIFREHDQWLDRAVVVICDPHMGEEYVGYSDAIVFPDNYVEVARAIGFELMTVSAIMARAGYITDQSDPHLNISGISRQQYIEDTLKKLLVQVERPP